MDSRKKILILHATAGHGHEKAAKAVLEAFVASRGADTRCLDVLDFTWPVYGRNYKQSYLFMIQSCPWLWGFFYHVTDNSLVYAALTPLRRLINGLFAGKLARFIREQKPDVVFTTHFLPNEVVSHLKSGGPGPMLVTVITDFMPHSFWIAPHVDRYVVSQPETREELRRRGVDVKKVEVFGIPIGQKFSRRGDQVALRARFGLDGKAFTALVTSGGAGVGHATELVSALAALPEGVQVLAVCGTNKALFQSLSKIAAQRPLLKVFGFVDNMDELMDAADVVVGKGGGLTISESLAKERPIVLFEPVPGQETRNADLVTRRGAGIKARSVQEVCEAVSSFAGSPDRLKQFKENARKMAKPQAAKDIVEFIEHGLR